MWFIMALKCSLLLCDGTILDCDWIMYNDKGYISYEICERQRVELLASISIEDDLPVTKCDLKGAI